MTVHQHRGGCGPASHEHDGGELPHYHNPVIVQTWSDALFAADGRDLSEEREKAG